MNNLISGDFVICVRSFIAHEEEFFLGQEFEFIDYSTENKILVYVHSGYKFEKRKTIEVPVENFAQCFPSPAENPRPCKNDRYELVKNCLCKYVGEDNKDIGLIKDNLYIYLGDIYMMRGHGIFVKYWGEDSGKMIMGIHTDESMFEMLQPNEL